MTLKQTILKKLYPLVMLLSKSSGGKARILNNKNGKSPKESFYDLKTTKNNNETIDFMEFKGKKVLLVNTASNCGYTGQYKELQQLQEEYKAKVTIVGFPANDFHEQEKSNDSEIAQFCQVNFGVTFPLSKKSSVVKGREQNPVYQWLTNSEKNGWNTHQPDWNFSKYLIDEKGNLTHYFGPAVSPLSNEMVNAIKST